jgi:hypothetical protein
MPPTIDKRRAEQNLQVTLRRAQDNTEEGLRVVGLLIVNHVKVLVTKPPYSAPDTPPGLRTGGLRLSYDSEVRKGRKGPYVAVFSNKKTLQPVPPGKPVVYAPFLEFGTRHMAARPHLRPAVNRIMPLIPGIVATSWRTGLERR